MNNLYRIACLVLCAVSISNVYAQQRKAIIRDTTYTISSATRKILQDYPYVKIAKAEMPDNMIAKYDLVYKKAGNHNLSADIYYTYSKKEITKPAIILVHGGGWRSGNKSMERYTSVQLASLGYFCMAIEYRLSPESVYPAAIHDILDAVNWIIANSSKYSIDVQKIVLMGESAGGHLASLAGIKGRNLNSQGPQIETGIKAIINIDGVMDMTVPSESGKDTVANKPSAAKQWIGFTFKEKPELWKEVSPVNYINKNTPPILFINSSIDRFHAGRDASIAKLNQLNIYSEVHTIPDSPHSFWFLIHGSIRQFHI